ncbi:hypothetical protein [Paraburkholderia sp. BCC1884]|uniref:hypothetical protein n=1 Tax=Paraburkholderia sp. BCC1884 TaxID=2562668 RepID=UPI001182631D|nr:hypothetical protein [Paraburkholderia sp. BCC1884]
MKRIAYLAVAVSMVACAPSVFAQSASPDSAQQPVANSNQVATGAADSGMGTGVSGQSAAGGPAGLTRGDVKQQLFQAERSGQLQNLNRTLYEGGS